VFRVARDVVGATPVPPPDRVPDPPALPTGVRT
jgi:hypothetical protein